MRINKEIIDLLYEDNKGEYLVLYNRYSSVKPLVTVITVVFNGEKFLEETIESVLNQTYDNVEFIIIDGGSTDGTLDIIKKYEDGIDCWISEKDSGIYNAMNKGIDIASGDWINFMNAGDVFALENTVESVLLFGNKDATIIYGNTLLRDNRKIINRIRPRKLNRKELKKGMIINHQSIFFKNIAGLRYDDSLKYKAEWDLLLRLYLADEFKGDYIDKDIAIYSLGGIGQVRFIDNFKEYLGLYKKYFGLIDFVINVPSFFLRFLRVMIKNVLGLTSLNIFFYLKRRKFDSDV